MTADDTASAGISQLDCILGITGSYHVVSGAVRVALQEFDNFRIVVYHQDPQTLDSRERQVTGERSPLIEDRQLPSA